MDKNLTDDHLILKIYKNDFNSFVQHIKNLGSYLNVNVFNINFMLVTEQKFLILT